MTDAERLKYIEWLRAELTAILAGCEPAKARYDPTD